MIICTYVHTYIRMWHLGTLSCPYDDDYRCPRGGACIRSYQLCDGYYDCNYGEDEENCSELFYVPT